MTFEFANPVYYLGDRSQPWQVPSSMPVLESLIDQMIADSIQGQTPVSKTVKLAAKVGVPGQILGEVVEITIEADGDTVSYKDGSGFVLEQIVDATGSNAFSFLFTAGAAALGLTPAGWLAAVVNVTGNVLYSVFLEDAVEDLIEEVANTVDAEFKLVNSSGAVLGGVWYRDGLMGVETILLANAIYDLLEKNAEGFPLAEEGMKIQYLYGNQLQDEFSVYDGQKIEDLAAFYGMTVSQFIGTGVSNLAFWSSGVSEPDFNLYFNDGSNSWVFARSTDVLKIDLDNDILTPEEAYHPSNIFTGATSQTGNANDNLIIGTSGNDTSLAGGAGNDTIFGGDGSDTFIGQGGATVLIGDSYYGGTYSSRGLADGYDTIDYSGLNFGVKVELDYNGTTQGYARALNQDREEHGPTDALFSIEKVIGTNSDDIIVGSEEDNTIFGGEGADWLYGGDGDDLLYGDDGNDWLNGGKGDDTLDGLAGNNTADYSLDPAGVTVNLATGLATDGWADTDTLIAIQNVRGSDGDDTLTGNSGANIFYGSLGNDELIGNGGNDVADYRFLENSIAVIATASGITVQKEGGTYTDEFDAIRIIRGTEKADSFTGTFRSLTDSVTYYGGGGADQYYFDLSVDKGMHTIIEDDGFNLDQLHISNFDDQTMLSGIAYNATTIDINYWEYNAGTAQWDHFFGIQVSRSDILAGLGLDLLNFGGETIHLGDLVGTTGSVTATSGAELFAILNDYSATGPGGGTNGTGAGGGTVALDDGQGNITGMKVSPLVDGTGVPQAYASTIWHPFVLTDYIGGTGGALMWFETYRQEIAFRAGFNEDNVRFTVTNNPGDANLRIHLDDLGLTYTINDFETGRYIEGLLVYDPTLHEWIQNADTATLTGSAGNYSGDYEGDNPPNPIGYVDVTYFLEKVSFTNGTTINMQGTLTFKGTSGNDSSTNSVYGLDTRGDILMGLEGNDVLRGYGGDDILIGGADRDTSYGGLGDDTYVYSLGEAPFSGTSYEIAYENLNEGTDMILFTEGIAPEDLRLWTDTGGDLFIQYSQTDIIRVEGTQVSGASRIPEIMERIAFFDETVWDLTNGLYLHNNDTNRILYGSNLHDTIIGGAGVDTLRGYGGNDLIMGGANRDISSGGSGNDTYVIGLGEAPMVSGAYEEVNENLNEGTDTILFKEGIAPEDLRLWTDTTGTLFIQYSETDFIRVQGSHTSNASRVGEHLEYIVFSDDTTWDLTNGLYLHNNDTARHVYGSNYADTIIGGAATDTLHGKGGNDVLRGGAGRDLAYGGLGDDTYLFDLGDAPIVSGNYEQVNENLNEGFDKIVFGEGINQEDVRLWTESSGRLFIQYSSTDFIRVDGSTTTGSSGGPSRVGEHLEQIVFADQTVWDFTNGLYLHNNDTSRSLYGSIYGDTILGGAGVDTINAKDGNDHLEGRGGNDTLSGDGGDDYLDGGAGNDTMNGGAGNDFFVFSEGQDIVTDTSGTDTLLITGVTIDQISFSNVSTYNTRITITGTSDYVTVNNLRNSNTDFHVDYLTFDDGFITTLPNYASWLWGGSGNDLVAGNANDNTLIGGAGNDEMYGNDGNDAIHGGAGADEIYGGDGDDLIHGGEGDDVIDGGAGADVLYGGGGADVFIWGAMSDGGDTVKDFSVNDNDKLDLRDILTGFNPGTDDILDFVQITDDGTDSTLSVDVNGTGSSYAALAILANVTGLDVVDLYGSGNLLAA